MTVDARFPQAFSVSQDGVDLGIPTPIVFNPGRFPELQPADVWEIDAPFDPNAQYGVTRTATPPPNTVFPTLNCTGIGEPPVDDLVCIRNGADLIWTNPADIGQPAVAGGVFQVRRVTSPGESVWEQEVASATATIASPESDYIVRFPQSGAVVNLACDRP